MRAFVQLHFYIGHLDFLDLDIFNGKQVVRDVIAHNTRRFAHYRFGYDRFGWRRWARHRLGNDGSRLDVRT